ncbi:tetratricopeptide repeat protein [Desulfonatronum parangueonense]
MSNQPTQTSSREIRVFISSTFRDMMRERDLLVKRVFPELRRKCAQRFVTFTEVDLRWGITEEQAAEGQVLPLCLAEIERSRPYFLGLLGERYGWIPDTVRSEVIEREPWIREHVEDRTSVTELEILHGVLRNPEMAGHAFFYFRDPAYGQDPERYPDFTDDERWALVEQDIPDEIEKYGEAEAARRTAKRKARLALLKQRIRDSKLDLVEPYANPEALAEIVFQQFDELIDQLYPEDQTPDPLTQERMGHEAHAKNKLYGCIDRPAHMAKLTEIAHSVDKLGKGIVLTGESGGGKTALLAAWARDVARDNPDAWLFQHYFGATPGSAAPEGFLRRLMGELKQRFCIAEDIPVDPEKLRDALPVWLARTQLDTRIVLVLDGLNQVQGSEADRRLRFVPYKFPAHVTVLASALPGPALDSLREREWMMYELPLATEAEADAMVAEYLKQIGRFVDAKGRPIETPLRRQIAAAAGSRNPLFLRTVLEELRQFGSFEKLDDRVKHYLEAHDPNDLFLRVIQRWQDDFDDKDSEGRDRDLVRRALTHLWAARQGLSEPEWLDLLGTADYQPPTDHQSSTTDRFSPLPRALWTPLFLALEPHLSQRSGLFAYGHDFLRQAVEQKWLAEPTAQHAAHLALADYFDQHPNQADMTPRKAAEWPFHLHAAQSWDRLEACLTNIPLFLALYNDQTKWELTSYWHPLRAKPLERDMGACYTAAYEVWTREPGNAADHSVPANLGGFLLENGHYAPAEPLCEWALAARERVLGLEHPDTLTSMNNLAALLFYKGEYAIAQQSLELVLDVHERVLGAKHPDTLTNMNNLAALFERKGDYEGAQLLLERALAALERVLGPEHPDTLSSVNNLAALLQIKGDYVGAQPFSERALTARERVLGLEHPDTLSSVNNLATLLKSKGDYAGAQPLFERALAARERVLGPEHPDTLSSVNNLATLLKSKGDYTGAQPLSERALAYRERVLGPEHPDTLSSVNNLATLLKIKGDYAGAQPLSERALAARERVLGPEHPDTLSSVNNLAVLLKSKGDSAGAQPLYERALEASERVLGPEHPNTLSCLKNLADLMVSKGDYAGAQPLHERALEARERVLGPEHPDTMTSLVILASLLPLKGDYAGAQPLHERALKVSERVLGQEHPDTLMIMNNLAALQRNKGDYAGAQPLYEHVLEVRERVLGPEHPNTLESVNNFAGLLQSKGDYEGAQLLYERVLEARERVMGLEHPDTLTSMNGLARLLMSKGDYVGAQPLYERALEARERVLGPEHPDTLVSVNNLAGLLASKGDYEGAQLFYERVLEARERVLGLEHPSTLTSLNNLTVLLRRKGDSAGAQPLLERTLIRLLKISAATGKVHPNLQECINNYAGCLKELGRGDAEIHATLNELMQPFGMSAADTNGTDDGPTCRLLNSAA